MPFTYDASADCCLSAENITSTAFIDVTALLDPRDASPTLNMGTEGILPSNVWCWLSFFARIVVLYKKIKYGKTAFDRLFKKLQQLN